MLSNRNELVSALIQACQEVFHSKEAQARLAFNIKNSCRDEIPTQNLLEPHLEALGIQIETRRRKHPLIQRHFFDWVLNYGGNRFAIQLKVLCLDGARPESFYAAPIRDDLESVTALDSSMAGLLLVLAYPGQNRSKSKNPTCITKEELEKCATKALGNEAENWRVEYHHIAPKIEAMVFLPSNQKSNKKFRALWRNSIGEVIQEQQFSTKSDAALWLKRNFPGVENAQITQLFKNLKSADSKITDIAEYRLLIGEPS